jgi:hypothetical protein
MFAILGKGGKEPFSPEVDLESGQRTDPILERLHLEVEAPTWLDLSASGYGIHPVGFVGDTFIPQQISQTGP